MWLILGYTFFFLNLVFIFCKCVLQKCRILKLLLTYIILLWVTFLIYRPHNCRLVGKDVVVYCNFWLKIETKYIRNIDIYIYLKEALKKYSHFCLEFVIIDFLVTPTHLIIQCQIVTFSENKKTIKLRIAVP
jgi:hypothetical protein